ncbi:recombinase family protein [Oceanobacillus sp. CAU 1775]
MVNKDILKNVEFIYGYIRRSRQDIQRERRVEEDTLAQQRDLITGLLKDHYDHIAWRLYEELGSGADEIESRPIFKGIITEIEDGFERGTVAFCVKEISRLGRGSYTQMGFLLDLLQQKEIHVITPMKIYNPNSEDDLRYLKFNMFMANQEYDMIKSRMVNARLSYAKAGKWMTGGGGIPDGYKFNPKTQKLEIDEDRAWVIRRIFDLYVNERIGYNGISTILGREGILTATGKQYWKPMHLRSVLRNPVYKGVVSFNNTKVIVVNGKKKKVKRNPEEVVWVPNAHPAIIDEETLDKAELIMQENRQSPKVRLDFEPQPLAGLIVCSSCENKMQRQYSTQKYKKKNGDISTYHKEFMICLGCKVYMKYRAIEEEILRILEEDFIEVKEDVLRSRLEELIDIENIRQRKQLDPSDRMELLESKIKKLNAKMKNLINMKAEDDITEEEYRENRKDILEEIEDTNRQIDFFRKETQKEQIEELDIESIQEGFKSVLHLYKHGELARGEKNELLRGIFDYVILEKTGKGKFNLHSYLKPSMLLNTSTLH